jgi:hypothetical protein
MPVFRVGVEHPLDVTIQCPHYADPWRTKKPRQASTGSSSGESGAIANVPPDGSCHDSLITPLFT